jgi:hypothetical protein
MDGPFAIDAGLTRTCFNTDLHRTEIPTRKNVFFYVFIHYAVCSPLAMASAVQTHKFEQAQQMKPYN